MSRLKPGPGHAGISRPPWDRDHPLSLAFREHKYKQRKPIKIVVRIEK